MLHYAIVFLVIALIAAVFGFGGIAASAVGIAKILFCLPGHGRHHFPDGPGEEIATAPNV